MADVSKISANSVEYTIKDATARSSISSIQSDINTINGDITAIEGDVSTLQGQMATAQGNISTLQNTATGLQNQINLLQTESANGYCKLPDGTMMQWGTTEVTSGSMSAYANIYVATVTVVFPQRFVDGNYIITGSSKFGTGAELAFGQGATSATQASVRVWDVAARVFSASDKLVVKWMAIGRWK